jgi:uncharacterized membrane protein YeiH
MLLLILDLLGVAVFAVSGGLLAVRQRLDIVGVLVLGVVTGLGGGAIRDVLIGDIPPPGLADWRYLVTALGAGLIAFWFHPAIERTVRLVNVFDAFGLGLFAVAGAVKASEYGLGPVPAALLGMVTGIGGGMIRDVLADRVPVVLSNGELYAIPALAGAAVAVAGYHLDVRTAWVAIPAAALTIAWRLLAIRRGWRAPLPRLRGGGA